MLHETPDVLIVPSSDLNFFAKVNIMMTKCIFIRKLKMLFVLIQEL